MPPLQPKSPRYFIKTYGCQMNVADSEKLRDVLWGAGYEEAAAEDQADILLINTCVVRQHAEDRAAWYITSAKGLKKDNPDLLIGICGCYVTEPDRDLKKQFPHVDWFIPPNSPDKLSEYLSSPLSSPSANSFPSPSKMERGARALRGRGEVMKEVEIQRYKLVIKSAMWSGVGIIRSNDSISQSIHKLERAIEQLDLIPISVGELELFNLLVVSQLIARGALERKESRGAHFRSDFPERDDLNWNRHLIYRSGINT